eukprot:g3412.t1 g3412   contig12:2015244-2015774(-)
MRWYYGMRTNNRSGVSKRWRLDTTGYNHLIQSQALDEHHPTQQRNRLNNVEVHSATLLLGDSWASLSGNQWADGKTDLESMTKAQYDYGYVWLSLGGNDFLDNKCDISMADDVAADIVTVISHLVDNAANEDIRILFFGYSVPSSDVCGDGQKLSYLRSRDRSSLMLLNKVIIQIT